ncbi:MAG TPA: PCRF domain-containing protein, partial [Saprospiraceae bacterium]|nr:PCRF domain-containing protein [Saprospiraceae bacterium]
MTDKLEAIQDRYHYLEERLSDPEVLADMKVFAKTNKEYKDLTEIVETYKKYKLITSNILSAREMLKDADPEMKEMAALELDDLIPQSEELEEKINELLIPKDPEDSKDVILEIRSGTGGDEASIFAGDLYRMYTKYFETKGWKTELLDENPGTVGGYNKIVLEVY